MRIIGMINAISSNDHKLGNYRENENIIFNYYYI